MTNASAITVTVRHRIHEEELLEIQRLRYRVYAEEMKVQLAGMDHNRKLLREPLDQHALHIYVRAGHIVLGSLRLNVDTVPIGLEAPLEVWSLPRPFVYCARLFILPEWRGTEVFGLLIRTGFDEISQGGAAVAVCHCYPHLQKLYSRMGFRLYGTPFAMPGLEYLGVQTPMSCALTDRRISRAA